jgi:hypothetical protein
MKIRKRDLIHAGPTAVGGVLWQRAGWGSTYLVLDERLALMYSECMISSRSRST